ncbi:MAG: amidohydrolase [Desulfobacterales bacterium]|nr:amidohydrolase [Desulfobacterales bacterium]
MDFSRHPMFAWLKDLRREFHRRPETAFNEIETTARIKETLKALGLELKKLDGLEVGAVGVLKGRPGKKVLGLRADIDALPIQELNNVPYKSQYRGRMHACGHDAHAAIMLGVAKNLIESGQAQTISGKVKFIFQPAEETLKGARAMIKAGVLKEPAMNRILACHMWTEGKVGQVGLYRGFSHAATDFFNLTITGKSTHGARPHKGNDPVVAGAHFVTALQTIVSRNINPIDTGVVTIGKFAGGTVANIIPDKVELAGTIRTFTGEGRDLVISRLKEMIAGMKKAFRVKTQFRFVEGVAACNNTEAVSETLYDAAIKVVGKKNVSFISRTTGGEDFALFTEKIPGALVRLGCMNPAKEIVHPLHASRFDIDESVMPLGVEIISRAVVDYLG